MSDDEFIGFAPHTPILEAPAQLQLVAWYLFDEDLAGGTDAMVTYDEPSAVVEDAAVTATFRANP